MSCRHCREDVVYNEDYGRYEHAAGYITCPEGKTIASPARED